MTMPLLDLEDLLDALDPVLHDGVYVYCVVPSLAAAASVRIIAAMHEREGVTIITPEADAHEAGLPVLFRAAWITLNVHSDLQAVGMTAAFSRTLADACISCNVVAGAYHDHLFVPIAQAYRAMARLQSLRWQGID